MTSRWTAACFCLAALAACAAAFADDGEAPRKNPIVNSGFEEPADENSRPPSWGFWVNATRANRGTAVIDAEVAHEGKQSVRFENPLDDAVTSLFTPRRLAIEPGETYTLSAWIKGVDGGETSSLDIMWRLLDGRMQSIPGHRDSFKFNEQWTRIESKVEMPAEARFVKLYPRLMNKGTVWIDAVQLEKGNKATQYEPGPASQPRGQEQ